MIKSIVFKEQKGITLIALVITIIVLLILVTVSISVIIGENGVLTQSSRAVINTKIAEIYEQAQFIATIAVSEQYQGKSFKESVEEGLKSYKNFEQTPEMSADGKTATIKEIETGIEYEINSIVGEKELGETEEIIEDIKELQLRRLCKIYSRIWKGY